MGKQNYKDNSSFFHSFIRQRFTVYLLFSKRHRKNKGAEGQVDVQYEKLKLYNKNEPMGKVIKRSCNWPSDPKLSWGWPRTPLRLYLSLSSPPAQSCSLLFPHRLPISISGFASQWTQQATRDKEFLPKRVREGGKEVGPQGTSSIFLSQRRQALYSRMKQ